MGRRTDDVEAINIVVEEQEMMKYVSSADTSPATLVSLLLNRAIGSLSLRQLCRQG